MNRKRRFLSIVLAISIVAASMPFTASASVVVAEWYMDNGGVNYVSASSSSDSDVLKAFENGWNAAMEAADSDHSHMMTFKLYADWNGDDDGDLATYMFSSGSGFNWWAIYIQDGAKVTLDLNGHIINRRRSDAPTNGNGEVIYVDSDATLNIIDSNPNAVHYGAVTRYGVWRPGSGSIAIKGGIITGGYSSYGAGGIELKGNSTVNFYGGTVCGNRTDQLMGGGGGFELDNDGACLTMYDGAKIMYNYASNNDGGGVEVWNGSFIMNGGEISHNKANNYGGGVDTYEDDGIAFVMNGGVICNNTAQYGGGVFIDSSVRINGGTICNNYATKDGGGIYFNDDDSPIVDQACIDGNEAVGNGGGIYINTDDVQIKRSEIKNNTAIGGADPGKGGGIYVDNDDIIVTECSFSGNSAAFGGGIYIYGDGMTVDSSDFAQNRDEHYGSAIYICDNSYLNTEHYFSNILVEGNIGGGIYVGTKVTVNLSGDVVVGNEEIVLPEGSHLNMIGVSDNSSVHYFLSGFDNTRTISSKKGNHNVKRFISGDQFYGIKWINDPYDSRYREVVGVPSSQLTPAPETESVPNGILEHLNYTTDGGNTYSLEKGVYTYSSGVDSARDNDAVFYYSDGYFEAEPEIYNPHLATMSLNMAMAGFYSSTGNPGTYYNDNGVITPYPDESVYENKHANGRQILYDIGVSDDDIFVSDYNLKKPGSNSIGISLGSKELTYKDGTGTGYTLVPIIVRGGSYEKEWVSNVTVGTGKLYNGEHQGFASAAEQAYEIVNNYIENFGLSEKALDGKLKFWIAGYSRGGAVTNLLSKRLTDEYCDTSKYGNGANRVYGYTFEAPQGGVDKAVVNAPHTFNGRYLNIHNCINKGDLVPLVGPARMGFKRYGVDHYIPGSPQAGEVTKKVISANADSVYTRTDPDVPTSVTTYSDNTPYHVKAIDGYIKNTNDAEQKKYYAQRKLAEEQLLAIDPSLGIDDYFHTATLNYISAVFYGLIEEAGSVDDVPKMDEWLDDFINDLLDSALSSRYCFSRQQISIQTDDNTTIGNTTFEKALRETLGFVFDLSTSRMNDLVNCVSDPLSHLNVWLVVKGISEGISLWDDALGDWDKIDDDEKAEHIETLWFFLIESFGVGQYLTEEEKEQLWRAWPVIADTLLRFVSDDYKNKKVSGVNETQVHLGTLINNMNRIAANHYPEITLSWVRSYDSFYTTANPGTDTGVVTPIKRQGIDYAEAPIAQILGEELPEGQTAVFSGAQTLDLRTAAGGDAIYYSVSVNPKGKDLENPEEMKVFRDGILLDDLSEEGGVTHYRITTYAMQYRTKSPVRTFYVDIGYTFDISFCDENTVVTARNAGEYTVIAVDYEDGTVKDFRITTQSFEVGENVLDSEWLDGLTLGTGDKLILLADLVTLRPLCSAFVVENGDFEEDTE